MAYLMEQKKAQRTVGRMVANSVEKKAQMMAQN
jgi:hypothetical protein